MEHIFNKGIFGNIICRTTLFLILFITGTASKPLWIWTKGCRVINSTEFVNQTETEQTEPYTCFHACGENTSTIALQGNRCRCNPEPTGIRPASYCEPCDGNKMAACGHVTKGYWSLYERANKQQLAHRGIGDNAIGCVVYSSKELFSVENCSKETRSLCMNAFTSQLICSNNLKTWTTDACDTGNKNDKLVDTFTAVGGTPGQCIYKYWIGLFTVDRASIEPLWIWTKGCWVTKSTDFLSLEENTPYTCFHACGENTLKVALQGNRCRCNPEPTGIRPASYCEPCDGNKMSACGHVNKGYWSLYERANTQQLTDRKIDDKAIGCVVYSSKEFSVENCSKKRRSLCMNALSGKLVCSTNSKTWTTDACDTGNRNDKLVDTFKAFGRTLGQCIYKYWIGLFSVDRASSHNVAPLSSKSVISSSSIDFSIRNILQTISSAGIILNVISPATISPTNISPIYIYPTGTLKDVSHTDVPPTNTSSTNSISANFSLTNISSTNPFPTSTFIDVSLTYISSTNISTSISPSSVSPACTSFTDVSATSISPNISLTDVPLSNISTDISFTRNNIFPTKISPAIFSTYDSLTNSFSSEIPSTLVLHTELMSSVVPVLSSTGIIHINYTSVPHTPTATSVQISPSVKTSTKLAPTNDPSYDFMTTILRTRTPVSSARTESSDKDSMVVLAVVGTVSAVAVVVVAMLAVYVRRSMKVIQMQQRRMTTMSDGPTMGSEETVFTDGDRSESIDDSFRDMPNTFSTAKRADLQVQGNWSLFSNRSRTVQDNEDVL